MVYKKVLFVIPGFRQQPTSRAYKELGKLLKNCGYSPILVKIPWKNSTISQNTEYFLKKFEKTKTQKKYILGFSYGAMIALIASTKVSSSGLIICSLSPYFKEDVTKTNKAISTLMYQRYKDFAKLHCGTLAKHIKARQIIMLYGTEESKTLIRRATKAFSQIRSRRKYLIPILKTEHDIGSKRYLDTIDLAARALL